jgi:hypothetical protein
MRRRVRYIRTDEHVDTLCSLAKAAEFAKAALDRPLEWKWLLIAVHASLQGSFVLVLSRGNHLLTLKPKHAAAWLKAYSTGGPWPDRLDLDYFIELYAKAKSQVISSPPSGMQFSVEKRHNDSMKLLNGLRNGFIHFSPQGWSIEAAGLPRLVLDCVEVCRYLLLESGAVVWSNPSMPNRAKREIGRLVSRLAMLERRYVG